MLEIILSVQFQKQTVLTIYLLNWPKCGKEFVYGLLKIQSLILRTQQQKVLGRDWFHLYIILWHVTLCSLKEVL